MICELACKGKMATLTKDGDGIATAMTKTCGCSDPPHPVCAQIKTMDVLSNVSIEIGSADCKTCSAPCYGDLHAGSSTGSEKRF